MSYGYPTLGLLGHLPRPERNTLECLSYMVILRVEGRHCPPFSPHPTARLGQSDPASASLYAILSVSSAGLKPQLFIRFQGPERNPLHHSAAL